MASAMQRHSSTRGGNSAMAYDSALREALTMIARDPSEPTTVRGNLRNRSLWALDPLRPTDGDPEVCPDYMWIHLNNITYDNCIKALGTKFSNIADTVPEGEGLALLDQMYQQAEPQGLGAVEDVEKEMDECKFQDGNDITEHLTILQALVKKFDRVSVIPFTEEKKKRFLLKTLPSSWQTPVQNWEASTLTFEELLPLIKEFTTSVSYLRMKEHGFAMVGGVLECYHCGGNHRIKDCPELPVQHVPGAAGKQVRYRDRGKGRPRRSKPQRLSRKDASALVSMLHLVSSSWASSDEEPEAGPEIQQENEHQMAMSAETATMSLPIDTVTNEIVSGDVVSLLTQAQLQAVHPVQSYRDRPDRDSDRNVPQVYDRTDTDFDRDFNALFGKRKSVPEPEIGSEELPAENRDYLGFYAKNENFDISSKSSNQAGKSELQCLQNSIWQSEAKNRHREGLYAKNVIFDQDIVIDSQTHETEFQQANRHIHSSNEIKCAGLSAQTLTQITEVIQYFMILLIWCLLVPLASRYDTAVFIMQVFLAVWCAKTMLCNIWDKLMSVTKIKTIFQTAVLPVMCQPKLLVLLVILLAVSALSYVVSVPQVDAFADHTALAGDIMDIHYSHHACIGTKYSVNPIQWEKQLLSPEGETFSVDFAVDSGCSTNTTNVKEVFLSMAPSSLKVITAEGAESMAQGTGYSLATVKNTEHNDVLTTMQLLYMPNFHFNLLSVTQLQDLGHSTVFRSKRSKQQSYIQLANGHQIPLSGKAIYIISL